jgi:predicted nucleotidyltransferase
MSNPLQGYAMRAPSPDFLALLEVLVKHGSEFIIVGGVSAVLHGAPVTTFDLDLVHSRTPDNIDRLLAALQDLDGFYRGRGDRVLRPGRSHLASPGHQLLMTRFGPLDLLGTIGKDHSYEDLLEYTEELRVGGLRLRVLRLEIHIQIKKEVGHEKDMAVIPILERTLREILKK